ncbi:O-methyltransferase [Irregularibacter muris]|uniref:tRNA 5-hydroxyuridine methyltransferase n=1 Tax=Irregularibacter muris TaxID=1796619 RepID=A0AAE3HEE4_9FIRM|nr:O-methyltransferase [Irregularibacter muris]MCR1897965.1 O-methyltransferase [Irregularibacter muris]
MNNINQDYIEKYIGELLPRPIPFIQELEEYAQKHNVPIVQPEVAQLLTLILKIQKSKNILEVGTAIGYSAIVFSKAMGEDSHILTIERDPEMVSLAKENIKKSGLEDKIEVLEGQAEDIFPKIDGAFDCIFLDAAKGHYMDFISKSLKLLKKDGLLISDNVLFRGMVATDALVKRRKITIVKRMRKYLEYISNHPQLHTSIIPIGDGVALSIKKE